MFATPPAWPLVPPDDFEHVADLASPAVLSCARSKTWTLGWVTAVKDNQTMVLANAHTCTVATPTAHTPSFTRFRPVHDDACEDSRVTVQVLDSCITRKLEQSALLTSSDSDMLHAWRLGIVLRSRTSRDREERRRFGDNAPTGTTRAIVRAQGLLNGMRASDADGTELGVDDDGREDDDTAHYDYDALPPSSFPTRYQYLLYMRTRPHRPRGLRAANNNGHASPGGEHPSRRTRAAGREARTRHGGRSGVSAGAGVGGHADVTSGHGDVAVTHQYHIVSCSVFVSRRAMARAHSELGYLPWLPDLCTVLHHWVNDQSMCTDMAVTSKRLLPMMTAASTSDDGNDAVATGAKQRREHRTENDGGRSLLDGAQPSSDVQTAEGLREWVHAHATRACQIDGFFSPHMLRIPGTSLVVDLSQCSTWDFNNERQRGARWMSCVSPCGGLLVGPPACGKFVAAVSGVDIGQGYGGHRQLAPHYDLTADTAQQSQPQSRRSSATLVITSHVTAARKLAQLQALYPTAAITTIFDMADLETVRWDVLMQTDFVVTTSRFLNSATYTAHVANALGHVRALTADDAGHLNRVSAAMNPNVGHLMRSISRAREMSNTSQHGRHVQQKQRAQRSERGDAGAGAGAGAAGKPARVKRRRPRTAHNDAEPEECTGAATKPRKERRPRRTDAVAASDANAPTSVTPADISRARGMLCRALHARASPSEMKALKKAQRKAERLGLAVPSVEHMFAYEGSGGEASERHARVSSEASVLQTELAEYSMTALRTVLSKCHYALWSTMYAPVLEAVSFQRLVYVGSDRDADKLHASRLMLIHAETTWLTLQPTSHWDDTWLAVLPRAVMNMPFTVPARQHLLLASMCACTMRTKPMPLYDELKLLQRQRRRAEEDDDVDGVDDNDRSAAAGSCITKTVQDAVQYTQLPTLPGVVIDAVPMTAREDAQQWRGLPHALGTPVDVIGGLAFMHPSAMRRHVERVIDGRIANLIESRRLTQRKLDALRPSRASFAASNASSPHASALEALLPPSSSDATAGAVETASDLAALMEVPATPNSGDGGSEQPSLGTHQDAEGGDDNAGDDDDDDDEEYVPSTDEHSSPGPLSSAASDAEVDEESGLHDDGSLSGRDILDTSAVETEEGIWNFSQSSTPRSHDSTHTPSRVQRSTRPTVLSFVSSASMMTSDDFTTWGGGANRMHINRARTARGIPAAEEEEKDGDANSTERESKTPEDDQGSAGGHATDQESDQSRSERQPSSALLDAVEAGVDVSSLPATRDSRLRLETLLKCYTERIAVRVAAKAKLLVHIDAAVQVITEGRTPCDVCYNRPVNAVLLHCGHVGCHVCLEHMRSIRKPCMTCRCLIEPETILVRSSDCPAKADESLESADFTPVSGATATIPAGIANSLCYLSELVDAASTAGRNPLDVPSSALTTAETARHAVRKLWAATQHNTLTTTSFWLLARVAIAEASSNPAVCILVPSAFAAEAVVAALKHRASLPVRVLKSKVAVWIHAFEEFAQHKCHLVMTMHDMEAGALPHRCPTVLYIGREASLSDAYVTPELPSMRDQQELHRMTRFDALYIYKPVPGPLSLFRVK